MLVVAMTVQYSAGLKLRIRSCPTSVLSMMPSSISVLTAYPTFIVWARRSPPVSPSVVAVIFVIQKKTVISGIFVCVNRVDMVNAHLRKCSSPTIRPEHNQGHLNLN